MTANDSKQSIGKEEILTDDIQHTDEIRTSPISKRTPLERQQALKAALEVDPGVKRWSLRAMQVGFTLCLLMRPLIVTAILIDVSSHPCSLLLLWG